MRIPGGVLIAYFVSYALVWGLARQTERQSAIDLLNVAGPLLAFFFCAFAARRQTDSRLVRFWSILAAAMFLSAAAESTWAFYELVGGIASPFPSVADLFGLLTYALEFGAVVSLVSFRHWGRLATAGVALEGIIFSLAAILLTWQFVMLPSLSLHTFLTANLVSVAYPGGDVLLLAAIASLTLLPRRGTMPLGLPWVAGAFLVKVVGDLAYARAQIAGTYATGSWIDPLWPLAYALLGAASVWQLTRSRAAQSTDAFTDEVETRMSPTSLPAGEGVRHWRDDVRTAVPYAAMPVACYVVLVSLINGGEPGSLHSVGPTIAGLVLIGLVLGRQAVTLVENHRLHESLTGLSRNLEARVGQRTKELSTLNQVALAMSRCGSSRQVVETGLVLAREALGCPAAGLWLRPEGSRKRFFGAGLDRQARLQLDSAAGARFASSRPIGDPNTAPIVPVVVSPSAGDLPPSSDGGPFSSVAVVPLVSRQTPFGALCLAPWDDSAGASPARLGLASAVAAQVAVAFENARRFEEANFLAQRDPITGLLNHRGMNGRLEEEYARCHRSGAEFTVVMMDLDNFRFFNDTYGHRVGDEVLQQVARILARAVRKYDVVSRFGGDEFLALLPDTNAAGAMVLVKRVQTAVREGVCFLEETTRNRVPITLSCGIASYPYEGSRLADVITVVDTNLHRAKQKGGNEITAPSGERKPSEKLGVFNVLDGLVTTVDNKDHYTRRHSDDVCDRAVALACKLGLPDDSLRILRTAGVLHDVGKIGVPDSILRKPGSLTNEEFEAIKQHVVLGKLIIKEIPDLDDVLAAVATHHERFDGIGYPEGLKGEEIPLLGRILAVTDAYSAMTTDRPYRRAFSAEEALTELQRVAGKQLDPSLVKVFVEVIQDEEKQLSTLDAAIVSR
jgi:diguanylate cyclase (GGDEF)-like protein